MRACVREKSVRFFSLCPPVTSASLSLRIRDVTTLRGDRPSETFPARAPPILSPLATARPRAGNSWEDFGDFFKAAALRTRSRLSSNLCFCFVLLWVFLLLFFFLQLL